MRTSHRREQSVRIDQLEPRRLLSRTFLSDSLWNSGGDNGWGPIEVDRSNGEAGPTDGRTITLNGQTYDKGLGVHAVSDATWNIAASQGYTNFRADVGVDDEVGTNGSVVFQVWLDTEKLFDSGVMTGASATKSVDVNIANRTGKLRLLVTDAGNGKTFDHGDWANARFIFPDPPVQTTASVGFGSHSGLPPSESGDSQTFEIGRSAENIASPLTVNFSTSGNAVRGSDYELRTATGTLITGNTFTFPANVQTIEFKIAGLQDTVVDPGESVTITLTPGTGYTVSPQASATTTIDNDDSPPIDTQYLSDRVPSSSVNGWGPAEHDLSNGEQAAGDGKRLTINGTSYDKGIGVHAGSDIAYTLGGRYDTFQAVVGVDDEVGNNGSVNFQVFADGTKIYDSGLKRGTDAGTAVSLDVRGVDALRLVVTDGGDGNSFDHADWADAKVIQSHTAPYRISLSSRTSTEGFTDRIIINVDGTASGPDPLSFDYETYDITAKAGSDYTPVSGHYTVQPGQFFIDNINIPLLNDKVAEAPEKLGVRIFNIVGNGIVAPNGGIMTITENGSNSPLSNVPPTSQTNGWGPVELNRSNGEAAAGDGKPITLNGEVFTSGLGVHAGSDLTYTFGGKTHFYSSIGVDDEVGNNGSVVFQVFIDGVKKYDSGVMTGSSATKFIDLDVTGASTLRLVVTDAGNGSTFDHADWAGAELT